MDWWLDPGELVGILLLGLPVVVLIVWDWSRGDRSRRWKLRFDSRTHVPFSGLVSTLRRCLRLKR